MSPLTTVAAAEQNHSADARQNTGQASRHRSGRRRAAPVTQEPPQNNLQDRTGGESSATARGVPINALSGQLGGVSLEQDRLVNSHGSSPQRTRGPRPPRGHAPHSNRRYQHGVAGRSVDRQSDLPRYGPERQFGGSLTVNGRGNGTGNSHERASFASPEATDVLSHQNHHSKPPRRPRSAAADISTRIHEDINNGQYECAICTNEVLRVSKVWSCRTCWTVFHLSCVRRWASNEGSSAASQQTQDNEPPGVRQWRCPGCNLPKEELPSTYTCWCAKEAEPRSISGLPPHSCGNTCGRKRVVPKGCPHPCLLPCHAGPCPPCTHMGPEKVCFCGKQSSRRKCVETNYEAGWACGGTCDRSMSCKAHRCPETCHNDACGDCNFKTDARCYCGKVERVTACHAKERELKSERKEEVSDGEYIVARWTGAFNCGGLCGRPFDCGKHYCRKNCHAQDVDSTRCPLSPDRVTHCPCGKSRVYDLVDQPRTSCQDPIPFCSTQCSRPLPCGHLCQQQCHRGDCAPCLLTVLIKCRCGRVSARTMCHQGYDEAPHCPRVCRVTLNCGRHTCDEHCCTGERKATERHNTKRKHRRLDSAPVLLEDTFEPEHICTRLCDRSLKCGNHSCTELCHKGPCGSCREAIFDEISCHCGRTVLQPPLPCGTSPPVCNLNCERLKPCRHPQIPHNCHLDTEECPKCPFLTLKKCLCGRNHLKNQPCWLKDVRCGEICGQKLKCGSHACPKPCHAPGECGEAGTVTGCNQSCGKPRKSCGHPDDEVCHAPYPCKEIKPCGHRILVTCPCQRLKQEMRCNATKDSLGGSSKMLKCNEECARLERNRKLALALNVDPESHHDHHVPYSSETLTLFQNDTQWALVREQEFRIFAADEQEKRLRFKPMSRQHRAFVHSLAEDFGLDSESLDPEPHRHVVALKTPRFVMAPMKTLSESMRIRNSTSSTIAAVSDGERKVKRNDIVTRNYNAILVTNPKFGLTIDEIHALVDPLLRANDGLKVEVSFLSADEVVMRAVGDTVSEFNGSGSAALLEMKPMLVKLFSKHKIGDIQLCQLDDSSKVVEREGSPALEAGWSRVAAKAAHATNLPRKSQFGAQNSYAVLGNKVLLSSKKSSTKKKEVEQPVVEDWEVAASMEEENEVLTSLQKSQGNSVDADAELNRPLDPSV